MRKIILAVAALFTFAGNACASTIVNQDRNNFESAYAVPYTVETFTPDSHFPITTGVLNSNTNEAGITPGMIQAGVTYSTPIGNDNFFNIDAGGGYIGGFLDTIFPNQLLTATFDKSVSAFGFDINGGLTQYVDVLINFDDNSTYTYQGNIFGMKFLGFSSDNGVKIRSAVIGSPQNTSFAFSLDNFTYDSVVSETPNTVPEPGSLLLLLTALGSAGLARRFKH